MNLSRRGFLGLLAGAIATPIIKPKRSFFFFENVPKVIVPDINPPKIEPFDLQREINRLGAKGGTVKIPSGTWILNQAIFIPGNVNLQGEGPLDIVGSHFLSPRDRKTAMIEAGGLTTVTGCVFENVGIQFDGFSIGGPS